MTYIQFESTVAALLFVPGPTNTLIGLAGSQKGLRYAVRLLPIELAGYLTTILPLVFLGAHLNSAWPHFGLFLKVFAGFWLIYMAIKLWKVGGNTASPNVLNGKKVFLTTLLNPKALVFALVLLPSPTEADFPMKMMMLMATIVCAGFAWGVLGYVATQKDGERRFMTVIQRIASIWLATVSISLFLNVFWVVA